MRKRAPRVTAFGLSHCQRVQEPLLAYPICRLSSFQGTTWPTASVEKVQWKA